jgi:transcriptional regulator of acetoin/glycerol metabolism
MQAVYQMIETVSEVSSTVLVTGESGTGKELAARYSRSQPAPQNPSFRLTAARSRKHCSNPNSSAMSKAHSRAQRRTAKDCLKRRTREQFSGRNRRDVARDAGQTLRVLQERKVRPVGAHEEVDVDTRVIAATNRDLPR